MASPSSRSTTRPASAEIYGSGFHDNARCGVSVFGASATLEQTELDSNAIALDGEPHQGEDFTFEDRGGNGCGCGEETEDCRVVSTGLTPPAALDP